MKIFFISRDEILLIPEKNGLQAGLWFPQSEPPIVTIHEVYTYYGLQCVYHKKYKRFGHMDYFFLPFGDC